MSKSKKIICIAAAVVVVIAAVLTAMSVHTKPMDIVGTWQDDAGNYVEFSADGTFRSNIGDMSGKYSHTKFNTEYLLAKFEGDGLDLFSLTGNLPEGTDKIVLHKENGETWFGLDLEGEEGDYNKFVKAGAADAGTAAAEATGEEASK